MSDKRRKPGAAFWTTIVLLVLLLYPASFGPACWLVNHNVLSRRTLGIGYRPFFALALRSPVMFETMSWWAGVCGGGYEVHFALASAYGFGSFRNGGGGRDPRDPIPDPDDDMDIVWGLPTPDPAPPLNRRH